jgi:hypothetical protein
MVFGIQDLYITFFCLSGVWRIVTGPQKLRLQELVSHYVMLQTHSKPSQSGLLVSAYDDLNYILHFDKGTILKVEVMDLKILHFKSQSRLQPQ